MAGLGETLEENARLREELASLRARHEALATEYGALSVEQATALAKVQTLTERTAALELLLARLQRRGPASERHIANGQPALFENLAVPPPPSLVPVEPEASPAEASPAPRGTPKRRDFTGASNLPRRKIHVPMPEGSRCVGCGGALGVLGTTEACRVEWVPGRFEIHEIFRDKCACPQCPGQGVLTPELPYALPRALCGNGLLARVIVDKFGDHLPLNRQSARMAREGFEVGTTTLSSWILGAADVLVLLAEAVRYDVLTTDVLQGDDTGFPVQDGTDGCLRKGRLWAFTDQEQVFYAFTDTKEGRYPEELLANFQGHTLLVDGGSEFNAVVDRLGLDRAGCWSHARRYFFEALDAHPHEAGIVLDVIRRLFVLESANTSAEPAVRAAKRQEVSKPLVDDLFTWVAALSQTERPSSALGQAIGYLRNQEAELRCFLDDPAVPLHNNLSELLLRQPVVGRKNWLFAGSEGGAKAAATMFTLLGSCRLQGIDPHEWLTDVLGKLATWPANRLHELTPKGWRERHLA